MDAQGWQVNRLQFPDGLHAMITAQHLPVIDDYLRDLRDAVATVKADPSLAGKGRAATYGMMAHLPLRGVVRNKVLTLFANAYRAGGAPLELDSHRTAAKQAAAGTCGRLVRGEPAAAPLNGQRAARRGLAAGPGTGPKTACSSPDGYHDDADLIQARSRAPAWRCADMRPQDVTELLALAALWGASFLFMRLGAAEFGPVALAALRVGLAALVLLPLLWQRRQVTVLRDRWADIAVVGVVNSAMPFVLFGVAALALNAGLSSIFNASAPLWAAFIAWAWLGERLTRWRVFGLVLGFAGVLWLAWDKASVKPGEHGVSAALAIAACLAATLCYGFGANYTKRRLGGVAPLAVATGSQLAAALALALPAWWLWPAAMPSAMAWASIVGSGLALHRLGLLAVFPPDRPCRRGAGHHRDFPDPCVRAAVGCAVPRRVADVGDAGGLHGDPAGHLVDHGRRGAACAALSRERMYGGIQRRLQIAQRLRCSTSSRWRPWRSRCSSSSSARMRALGWRAQRRLRLAQQRCQRRAFRSGTRPATRPGRDIAVALEALRRTARRRRCSSGSARRCVSAVETSR